MPNITLSLSEELKKKIEEHPEVNWSALMKKYIEMKVERLAWKERMFRELENEARFDDEALEIGGNIKEAAWKRLKKAGW
jgi:hypothetical protein